MTRIKICIYKGLFRMVSLLFLISIIGVQNINAQSRLKETSRVEMKNGNIHHGDVLYEDEEIIELSTLILGTIKIQKKDILSISKLKRLNTRKGQYWSNNLMTDRYFLAPSAFNLKRGQIYYQNNLIAGNLVSVGLTDRISAEGGFVGFQDAGSGRLSYWTRIKVNIPIQSERFHLGAGAFYASILHESTIGFSRLTRNEGINIYVVGTFGSKANHVSSALSYGTWNGYWEDGPVLNVSGQFQVYSATSFLFEVYTFLPFNLRRLGFIGLRTDWKKVSFSYGLASFNRRESRGLDYTFNTLPWFGLSIRFGDHWE